MLWDSMSTYLKSWFVYDGLAWHLLLISIALGLVFGAIWLLAHWPPLFKKPWLWAVAIAAAFLTVLAGTFVQTPVRYYYLQLMQHFWSTSTLSDWLLLTNIPVILIMGLVQEGAKMVPIVFWWWRSGKKLDPKMGLAIGALAGAGLGLFDAVYVHNQVFIAGWTWNEVRFDVWQGLLPFWDKFWMMAGHIAISAIAGYGLAKGKGWQFYLLASGLHTVVLYIRVLYSKGTLDSTQTEILVAGAVALITLYVLWLRWRKDEEKLEPVLPDKPENPGV
jgi:RsiW-degrading membrane proteinase PrsW (M82 family)